MMKNSATPKHGSPPSPVSHGQEELERTVQIVSIDGEDGAMLHAKVSHKQRTKKEAQVQQEPPKIFSNKERSQVEIEEETKQYMEMLEKLKKMMAIPARILKENVKEFNSLSTSVVEKIEFGKKGCQKLATHLEEFNTEVEARRSQLKIECETKDFDRHSVNRAKYDSFGQIGITFIHSTSFTSHVKYQISFHHFLYMTYRRQWI